MSAANPRVLSSGEVVVSITGLSVQSTNNAVPPRETTAVSRGLTPDVRRTGAMMPARVARNLGRSVATTADQVQRVGKGLADVAQAVAFDRQNARTKGKQLAGDARVLLRQMRVTVDLREVVGGFAGLTAGEVAGGAVGGVVGTLVGGPAGAVVGAEVGAFTAGMLGMKLGTEAARELNGVKTDGQTSATEKAGEAAAVGQVSARRGARMGEIVGLTSGAAVGRIAFGPIGGLAGAVLGEVVGGQMGQEPAGGTPASASALAQPTLRAAERLNRFGKRTAGEAATILAAGAVGSVFGPGGRAAGRRLGLVVGRQIKWETFSIHSRDGGHPADASKTERKAAHAAQDVRKEALGELR